jgi:hypothetical protein
LFVNTRYLEQVNEELHQESNTREDTNENIREIEGSWELRNPATRKCNKTKKSESVWT